MYLILRAFWYGHSRPYLAGAGQMLLNMDQS
ncbi:uncharacterized protein METZ01_LOCUS319741, partial [marine metagenome]